jgi:hypothetical protein
MQSKMSKTMSILVGVFFIFLGVLSLYKNASIILTIVFILVGGFIVIKKPPFNSNDNAESGSSGGDCD